LIRKEYELRIVTCNKINFLAFSLPNCDARGRVVISSWSNLLLPEPFNFLSCRFYIQATGNTFTSRQFSLEAPRRFVVGCTCCSVATGHVARELSSGNVVITRHSVGDHLANCSYARLFSVQSRNTPGSTAPTGFPESAKLLDVETANFFSFFFFWERSAPGAKTTDGKSLFHSCCKRCSRIDKERICSVIHWKEIKGDVFVTKVLRSWVSRQKIFREAYEGFPSSNFKTRNLVIEIIKFLNYVCKYTTNKNYYVIYFITFVKHRSTRYRNLFFFYGTPCTCYKSGTSTVCLSRCSIVSATWPGIAFGVQFFGGPPAEHLPPFKIRQKSHTFSPPRILCRISSEIFLDRKFNYICHSTNRYIFI